MNIDTETLLNPSKVWSRSEVLSKPCPVPKSPGVYACYFREVPPQLSFHRCIQKFGLTLLYIGISPSAPPRNKKPPSKQTLYDRIRNHFNGNAEGSTLRKTLGCLLSEELNIQLRRVGNGKRMTFWAGEDKLDEWMGKKAFVTWLVIEKPWILEERLISELMLPLNLDKNKSNPNHDMVSKIRSDAKALALKLSIIEGY
jgi:hypothetical protein